MGLLFNGGKGVAFNKGVSLILKYIKTRVIQERLIIKTQAEGPICGKR